MSLKQKEHRNHYVSSLAEFPEDETVTPSNTTSLEELGLCLVDDEEAKTLDSDEERDEPTPEELKTQFFSLIVELQRKFPTYTTTDFRKYLEEDKGMAEQLQILKDNFNDTFKDTKKSDPEYINLLIGLSSIGIQITKDEGDNEGEDEGEDQGEDEGEDKGELTKSIINIELEEMKIEDEPETDV